MRGGNMDITLLLGSIGGAWIVTRIVYIIINFKLNPKQEATVAFVVGLIISLLLGKLEYFIGFLVWFLLDVTSVTNKPRTRKNKSSNRAS
jgi:hypothetical protein